MPQLMEARSELAHLMKVEKHVISPQSGRPCVKLVQDCLSSIYMITLPSTVISAKDAMQFYFAVNKPQNPFPVGQQPFISGRDLFMFSLISQRMKRVVNPETLFPLNSGRTVSLIHDMYLIEGERAVVDFISDAQRLGAAFLRLQGFSCGYFDTKDYRTDFSAHDLVVERSATEMQRLQKLENVASVRGKAAVDNLRNNNMIKHMLDGGAKGKPANVMQMSACVGQQIVGGQRPGHNAGKSGRTLPHFTKEQTETYAPARGFVKSCFRDGLDPIEYFFTAQGSREGMTDTSIKSVTGDTEILISERGANKVVQIGPWIDELMSKASPTDMEQYGADQLNLLNLRLGDTSDVKVVTGDSYGNVTMEAMTAVCKHDNDGTLYDVRTKFGRKVTVPGSKALLVWDGASFVPRSVKDVNIGDCMPTIKNFKLDDNFLQQTVSVADIFEGHKTLLGSEFNIAKKLYTEGGIGLLASKWWTENQHVKFNLPFSGLKSFKKAFRASFNKPLLDGIIYPLRAQRVGMVPRDFILNEEFGRFVGLYLAEGSATVKSGVVSISNNDAIIRDFVANWFDSLGITHKVYQKAQKPGHEHQTSISICGYSSFLAKIFLHWCGHLAHNKKVPEFVYSAPLVFVRGLLDGYFSGDGSFQKNFIYSASASSRLTKGIAFLLTRFNIACKLSVTKSASGRDSYRLSISGEDMYLFSAAIPLVHAGKQKVLSLRDPNTRAANLIKKTQVNDVVLDPIVEIVRRECSRDEKLYDVTVPSTLNFALFNGLVVRDTSETGALNRRVMKALENLRIEYDNTVRDTSGNIHQFIYGGDGYDPIKLWPPASVDGYERPIRLSFNGYKFLKYCGAPVYLESDYRTNKEFAELPQSLKDHIEDLVKTKGPFPSSSGGPGAISLLDAVLDAHRRAGVEPGEAVGNTATQSIGEISTQASLNSVDGATKLLVDHNGNPKIISIGELVDTALENTSKTEKEYFDGGSTEFAWWKDGYLRIPAGQSCGTVEWMNIRAVTRHPVRTKKLLEVRLGSGRVLRATAAKSFVTMCKETGRLKPTMGSDLKVGDDIPVSIATRPSKIIEYI